MRILVFVIRRFNRYTNISRLWSYRELRRLAPRFRDEVVNISGWKDEDKESGHYRDYFTSASTCSITNCGGVSCSSGGLSYIAFNFEESLPKILNGRFDAVFNHTVLEHVFEVTTAFKNLASMTCDILIVAVPFCQSQHESISYSDCWHFTPSTPHRLCELLAVLSRHPEHYKNELSKLKAVKDFRTLIGRSWSWSLHISLWCERIQTPKNPGRKTV